MDSASAIRPIVPKIVPKPEELIERARGMIPSLAARSVEQQKNRHVLPDVMAKMQAAGFFHVLQPKRWGGYEMELSTFYEIQMALGEGDMSAGWVYGTLGAVSWFLGLIDDRAAQEVWGSDPHA